VNAPGRVEVLGFDADDTLWHNERYFNETQRAFHDLLAAYAEPHATEASLLAAERRNLAVFGYGVKGFLLSMIETAIEISDGAIPASQIARILTLGKELLTHPVELLPHAAATVRALATDHRLVLITKGDLFHQETKIAASGLAECFDHIEVVAEKDEPTYTRIFERHRIEPARFAMVGNSLKSDILPVLELGGRAVHVPYEITWAMEHAMAQDHHDFVSIADLSELPGVLARWAGAQ
jgi:putative hydrolase of the HAD superfamily